MGQEMWVRLLTKSMNAVPLPSLPPSLPQRIEFLYPLSGLLQNSPLQLLLLHLEPLMRQPFLPPSLPPYLNALNFCIPFLASCRSLPSSSCSSFSNQSWDSASAADSRRRGSMRRRLEIKSFASAETLSHSGE